jgi:hypothetical protein
MPTSRILLLGVLPRFDVHTLPGCPWDVFQNEVQVMGGPYDKGLEQVCLGRAAICNILKRLVCRLIWGHSAAYARIWGLAEAGHGAMVVCQQGLSKGFSVWEGECIMYVKCTAACHGVLCVMQMINAANAAIAMMAAADDMVSFLDCGSLFLTKSGNQNASLFNGQVHPNAEGGF